MIRQTSCGLPHAEIGGWCIPELLVAAAILAAVEPWHPARRDWHASSLDFEISSAGPGGRMRALYGSQDGRRYSAANNFGMLGFVAWAEVCS